MSLASLGDRLRSGMTRFIEDGSVDVVIGALVGMIDVEGGPTKERCAVLQALASGYWGRSDLHV